MLLMSAHCYAITCTLNSTTVLILYSSYFISTTVVGTISTLFVSLVHLHKLLCIQFVLSSVSHDMYVHMNEYSQNGMSYYEVLSFFSTEKHGASFSSFYIFAEPIEYAFWLAISLLGSSSRTNVLNHCLIAYTRNVMVMSTQRFTFQNSSFGCNRKKKHFTTIFARCKGLPLPLNWEFQNLIRGLVTENRRRI